jgi:hypothetical protein
LAVANLTLNSILVHRDWQSTTSLGIYKYF